MIDLDSLKFVNDRYGHLFGDKVLKEFGIILIDSIQKNDIACRFSGDEFVVLIRDVDIDRLSQAKQKIQVAVDTRIGNNEKFHGLGFSIGPALFNPGQPQNTDILIRITDKSMYTIKQNKKALRLE